MAFYAMVFGITLFLSFFFVPVVFFGSWGFPAPLFTQVRGREILGSSRPAR
jgi:hypothetical protein